MNTKPLEIGLLALRAIIGTILVLIVVIILAPFLFVAFVIECLGNHKPGKSMRQILAEAERDEEMD